MFFNLLQFVSSLAKSNIDNSYPLTKYRNKNAKRQNHLQKKKKRKFPDFSPDYQVSGHPEI